MELSVKVKTITPQEAQEIINKSEAYYKANNASQRNSRKSTVKQYAKDMLEGKWKLNFETIKFTNDGVCIDGYHRLKACVLSNVPLETAVAYGVDIDVMDTVDQGRVRTSSDAANIAGHKMDATMTSIVKSVLTLKKQCKQVGQSKNNAGISTIDEKEEFYKYESQYNEARKVSDTYYITGVLSKKEIGSIYFYLVNVLGQDKMYVETFFNKLKSPMINCNDVFDKTYRALQSKIVGTTKQAVKGADRIQLYIDCWCAYVDNRLFKPRKNNEWFRELKNVA